MSPAKKAKVLARLKRVRPKATGGSKSKSLATGGGGGGSSPATGSTNKAPKIGASYQAMKAAGGALAPVTDKVIRSAVTKDVKGSFKLLEDQVRSRPGIVIRQEAAVIVDAAIDKKMQQANAITKGSATAILPEVYLWLQGYEGAKGKEAGPAARDGHAALNIANTGYDPRLATIDYGDPTFKAYRIIKHVGHGIRLARSKSPLVKRITSPVAKLLGMAGGRV